MKKIILFGFLLFLPGVFMFGDLITITTNAHYQFIYLELPTRPLVLHTFGISGEGFLLMGWGIGGEIGLTFLATFLDNTDFRLMAVMNFGLGGIITSDENSSLVLSGGIDFLLGDLAMLVAAYVKGKFMLYLNDYIGFDVCVKFACDFYKFSMPNMMNEMANFGLSGDIAAGIFFQM